MQEARRQITVAVVEDNPRIRELLQEEISDEGHRFLSFGTAEDFLRAMADSDVTQEVVKRRAKRLEAYAADPTLVPEHFGIERDIAEGGYGRRQIYELVQNGADAALDDDLSDARVSVVYTGDSLYCANQGEPITPRGVEAILGAYNSDKRSNQIAVLVWASSAFSPSRLRHSSLVVRARFTSIRHSPRSTSGLSSTRSGLQPYAWHTRSTRRVSERKIQFWQN